MDAMSDGWRCGARAFAPAAAIVALLMLGTASAAAQMRRDLPPEATFRVDPMRDLTSSGGRPLNVVPSSSAPVTLPPLNLPHWLGSTMQVEPSQLTSAGTYTRPRIIFGMPSDSMRQWMHDNGVAAERCYLPMVRARAKLSPDGEASASLLLYARCTFQ